MVRPRTPTQRRRAGRRRNPKQDILRATESLLLDRGLDGFSIRRLSERCGYRAPTIYHYFGDRRGLLDALLEERFSGLLEQLERVPLGGDELADLRALSRALVAFGLANPSHYAVLAAPRAEGEPAPAASDVARRILEKPFESLHRSGRLVTREVETAQQSLWVFLHGFITLHVTRPDMQWSPDLLDAGLDALLGGLVHPASPQADAGNAPR